VIVPENILTIQVNFAGRIIGTRGAEMKRFQDNTGVRLFVCGRGSMSDKKKVCAVLTHVNV